MTESGSLTTGLEPAMEACLAELSALPGSLGGPDPYWPKWHNGWWQLALLRETGLLARVPAAVFEAFAARLDAHYLHHFPLVESELPAGCDPYRDILCFCALGTAAGVLAAGGLDPWRRLPWLRDWLTRYRLPDGGYNCDEQAYTGSRKSSIVSSVPVLEALLEHRPAGDFSPPEAELLQAGLDYLLAQRLFRRRSNGAVIDEAWLVPLFPRFYHYDLLRGLSLVTRLAEALARPLPAAAIDETIGLLEARTRDGVLSPQAWYPGSGTTLMLSQGAWERGVPVSGFELLALVSRPETGARWISQEWEQARARLGRLRAQGLLSS